MRPADRWAHLMSIPLLLDWSPGKPCAAPPYLSADLERVSRWRATIGTHGFKVGVCWHGAVGRPDSHLKALPLELLAPLAGIDNVRLISLQKGGDEGEAGSASFALEVPEQVDDDGYFCDTPAIIANLDLVVTVDTSIGHVAGAMARPVFIMLHGLRADWRWLNPQSRDTPWYPSAKLFRQQRIGDWSGVIAEIADAIACEVTARTG
jgi:hypothetical protein